MRTVYALTLAALCVGSAFAAEPYEAQFSRMEMIDKFVYEGPQFIGTKTLPELRKLGVLHEKVEKSPNPHISDKVIEYRTLTFDGLEIYGDIPKPQKLAPIKVTVTSPKWKIQKGLSVGSPVTRITETLGRPNKTNDGSLEYCGETECVYFFTSNGKISKIEFRYYAD